MRSKLEKIDNKGIWTAHMSDLHQSENYVREIQVIDPLASELFIEGDAMQCWKNKRPSKGKVRGTPGVDNGFGETVQKWALEVAAYINHGEEVKKGEKPIEFSTIRSGFLNKESKNYEDMHKFFRMVVKDTEERFEKICEVMYQKNKETGLGMTLFPGHDNAYDIWLNSMFPDIPTIASRSRFAEHGGWEGIEYATPFGNHFKFRELPSTSKVKGEDGLEATLIVAPLYALPKTKQMIKEYLGLEKELKDDVESLYGHSFEKRVDMLKEAVANALGKTDYLIFCSHEGPKESSDIVHKLAYEAKDLEKPEDGKNEENRSMFEAAFATPNNTGTKIIRVHGNCGFPIATTNDLVYGAGKVPMTVHHLAEMDVKGDPMSNRGGVSYINHKSGRIITPQEYRGM